MKIVALYGAIGSGKSTLARSLWHDDLWDRQTIAQPIYDMMEVLLPGVRKVPSAEKSLPRDELGGKSIRFALQTLGTEWGRNIMGVDIWINRTVRRARELQVERLVIDDLRFNNELRVLQNQGAIIVKIERPGHTPPESALAHASEQDSASWVPDFTVINSGSINQLATSFKEQLKQHEELHPYQQ